MRVRICYTSGLDPCGISSYGEVEDYTIKVNPALANDVATVSIDNISSPVVAGIAATPMATVVNNGTNLANFSVTLTITPGTYSSTQNVAGLATGVTAPVTFANWTPTPGTYLLTVTTNMSPVIDENPSNDTKTLNVSAIELGGGTWSAGGTFPTTTYLGTGVGYTDNSVSPPAGYLFSIAGNTGSGLGTECYKYDITAGTWSPIADLPAGRRVLASALVGNFIYAIGGSDMSSVYQNTVFKYDIALNTWTTLTATLPVALGWGKAVAHGTDIYFAGGVDAASTVVNTVYRFNTVTEVWTTASPMLVAKFGGGFTVTGNTLVYACGADLAVISNTVHKGEISLVDPDVITWALSKNPYPGATGIYSSRNVNLTAEDITKTVSGNPTKGIYPGGTMYRFDAAPWGTDGIILAAGSPTADWLPADPNPCYVYKPATDSWILQPNLTVPVLGPSLGSVDLLSAGVHTWKLVVAGGLTTAGATTTATQILTEVFGLPTKTLNITVLLEGLSSDRGLGLPPVGTMFKAQGSSGNEYPGDIADKVTVELHNSTTGALVTSLNNVNLSTSGLISEPLDPSYSGNYFIYIKHRNSVTTSSITGVPFTGSTIAYDFTTGVSQAYGSNMKFFNGKAVVFGGDENSDCQVESTDMIDVDNDGAIFAGGYLNTDINGDGVVDSSDMIIVDNNNSAFVGCILPF